MTVADDVHAHPIDSGGEIRHRLEGSTTVFGITDGCNPNALATAHGVNGHILLWLTPDEALALAATLVADVSSLRVMEES